LGGLEKGKNFWEGGPISKTIARKIIPNKGGNLPNIWARVQSIPEETWPELILNPGLGGLKAMGAPHPPGKNPKGFSPKNPQGGKKKGALNPGDTTLNGGSP